MKSKEKEKEMKKVFFIYLIAVIFIFVAQISFAQETFEKYGIISVSGGEYKLANNEWGSDARQCIKSTGGTGFTVSACAINQGSVGSFASIWKGCHWGDCTTNSGCPIQVSKISSASAGFSVSSARPSGNYDVITEAWLSPNSDSTKGYNGGCELMIVLDYHGMTNSGGQVGTFNGYTVYETNIGWNFVTYVKTGTSSMSINLKDFINDAMSRGYVQSSWYLHDFEAGFEIMSGGVGLTANSFSFSVGGGGTTTTSSGATNPPNSTTTTSSGPTNPPGTSTTTSAGGSASGCTCKAGCSSQTTISSSFTKDGAGEFCFVASSLGSYINSWNLDSLIVNGTDYTNKYATVSSLPKNSDGKYYIYYKGSYSWGHFEAK
jgi:hypothetical protein